jgi:hypothetical protein
MQLKYVRSMQAGERSQAFLNAQAAILGPVIPPEVRAELDTLVAQLQGLKLEQETARMTSNTLTTGIKAMRADLAENFITPIGSIAVRKLARVPEFQALVMPLSIRQLADFRTRLDAMIQAAAKYESYFISGGLPADFLAQLKTAAANLAASGEDRGRNVVRRIAASDGIVKTVRELQGVIDQLDAVLTPVLKTKPTLLADWTASKTVIQTAVNPLPTGPVADATGTPAPDIAPATPANPAAANTTTTPVTKAA